MKKIVFATGNKGKLAEARAILGEAFEVISPRELGITSDPEETGLTFKENSAIKARAIYAETGLDCFADDSGLQVDCLGGKPGVKSARYADEEGAETTSSEHNFDACINKVIKEIREAEGAASQEAAGSEYAMFSPANFATVVTLILDGKEYYFEGKMHGHIISEKRGTEGFGYDPVFVPEGGTKTLSEMEPEAKNAISHRGQALRLMAAWLQKQK